MGDNTDMLIFVEDPGAANYVAPLPAALADRGWHTVVLAVGIANNYLLERGVSTQMVYPSATANQILNAIQPRVLLVGTAENPDTLGLALVDEARSAGITSVGVIDAAMNAEYRFRGRSGAALTYAPDWLLVPDKWTKETYVALGYPAKQVIVCGHPHYDFVHETAIRLGKEDQKDLRQRLLPLGVPDGQKVVMFGTEGSVRVKSQPPQCLAEYALTGRGTSIGRTEIVLEEFLSAIELVESRPYLMLRLHPKDTRDDYKTYLDEFDFISSGGSPLELIYAADLVVGLTSMLLLEAALLGKPTLSIVPRRGEMDFLPTIRMGITPCVTTREQLSSALAGLLQDRPQIVHACLDLNKVIVPGTLQKNIEFIEGLLLNRSG